MNRMSGIILGLPEEEYHAHPALSSTGARALLEAPARFEYALTHPRARSKAFDIGTAVHTTVLGTGWPIVSVPAELLSDDGGVRSAAAKAWRDEAIAAGKVVVKQAELDTVRAMSDAILAHPSARALLEQDGHPEASVFGTDPETDVECRARFDFLGMGSGRRLGVDVKKTASLATPVKFAKTVAEYGYHVQDAHYTDTLSFIGEHVEALAFVVVEAEPPHLVSVIILDGDYREIGRARAKRARELFAHGIQTGEWPGYPTEIQIAHPPMWAIYDHTDTHEIQR